MGGRKFVAGVLGLVAIVWTAGLMDPQAAGTPSPESKNSPPGCSVSAGQRPQEGEGRACAGLPEILPPGCDGARPAVVHHPDAVPVADPEAFTVIPCLVRTGFDGYEPTIGLTASGAVFARLGENPFLIPPHGEVRPPLGVALSADEGATWTQIVPQIAGVPTHPAELDPVLYVDPFTSRIFVDDITGGVGCASISWSDDEGATWEHSTDGCFGRDRQDLFTGPPVSSPTLGYPNVVYRCTGNGGFASATTVTTCQRSLDGGRLWLPAGAPAFIADPTHPAFLEAGDLATFCNGIPLHGIVDGHGRVYLPKGWCGEPWLAISSDEALTWTPVRVSDLGMMETNAGSRTADKSDDFYGEHAFQAGVGVDPAGNVYYVWSARDHLPYLAISGDGGMTWGTPIMIAPPGLIEAVMPVIAIGGVGKVVIAYMGSTDSPGPPYRHLECLPDVVTCFVTGVPVTEYDETTWHGYVTASWDALADTPTFHTAMGDVPEDPFERGACGVDCGHQHEFLDIRLAPDGTPWAAFVDGCAGSCVTGEPMGINDREVVAVRLWGGPSLWDAADGNGPYP